MTCDMFRKFNIDQTNHNNSYSSTQSTMRKLSSSEVDRITQKLISGQSHREIKASTGASLGSISKIRSSNCPGLPRSFGGRPSTLSPANVQYATSLLNRGKAKYATTVARRLSDITNKPIHPQTVRRCLKEAGLKARKKVKKPYLSKKNKQDRLDFAIKHRHFTEDDWKKFIWSDESKINRFGSDGMSWVWVPAGEGLSNKTIQPTVKYGGGRIMIWGCMTWEGVGYCCKIDGNMDADLYVQILEEDLLATTEYYGLNAEDYIFQQDNDPKHTSKKAKKWFQDNGIEVLKWPAQSPDLNPIEHLWDYLKKKLLEYEHPPKGMLELWERIEKEWNAIPASVCQNLIASMPRRMEAVIKAKGGNTKY
jgi:transposase